MFLVLVAGSALAQSPPAPENPPAAHPESSSPDEVVILIAEPQGPAKSSDAGTDLPNSGSPPVLARRTPKPDFNRGVYYKNKLEFSWENGVLPANIPFLFDLAIGRVDVLSGLNYTLVPFLASVRWHLSDIGGPWVFRGNWDMSFSGAYVLIPRGPETRYWAFVVGIRRNFVQRNWRAAPYIEGRAGVGDINAKAPYACTCIIPSLRGQGQDLDFTVMVSVGMRYNFSPRYSLSVAANYMHISNLYLSEPRYLNEGINVAGPMIGLNVRLGKEKRPE